MVVAASQDAQDGSQGPFFKTGFTGQQDGSLGKSTCPRLDGLSLIPGTCESSSDLYTHTRAHVCKRVHIQNKQTNK